MKLTEQRRRSGSALRPLVQSLRASRQGATAAEFALVLPMLLLILCGAIQYGVLMFTYNNMLTVARNGARAMAVGTATPDEVEATAKLGTSINSDYHGAEVFWRCDVSDAAGSGRFWPVLSRLVADFLSFGRSYPMAARRSWKTSRSML